MGKTPGVSLILVLCMIFAPGLKAGEEVSPWDDFIDQEDGKFDVSDWLGRQFGFLPTPIIITGPTFGNGLGLNLLFLHDSFVNDSAAGGRYIPPSISGVAYAGGAHAGFGEGLRHEGNRWYSGQLHQPGRASPGP